jgi:hypothetical protein
LPQENWFVGFILLTITPTSTPSHVLPLYFFFSLKQVSEAVISALLVLSAPGTGNMVVIQSPRSSDAMEACLGRAMNAPGHNIAFAAEYGMFVKVRLRRLFTIYPFLQLKIVSTC